MEVLKEKIKNRNNKNKENNQNFLSDSSRNLKMTEEPIISEQMFQSSCNNNQNQPNKDFNDNEKKEKKKRKINDKINDKIICYLKDLEEISEIVPYCEEKYRRELLIDRALILSLKINEYIKDYELNKDDILKKGKENEINEILLDKNYWIRQKVDKYALSKQRERIPEERWFTLKDNSFSTNLNKCFALNNSKFIDNYKWLMSLEKEEN